MDTIGHSIVWAFATIVVVEQANLGAQHSTAVEECGMIKSYIHVNEMIMIESII